MADDADQALTRPPAGHAAPLALLTALILLANAVALVGPFNYDPFTSLSGVNIITHRGFWLGIPTLSDNNNGYTVQGLGYLAAQDWLHLAVPWWNPYSGVGMPLAAELQNEALFLPFVLLLHFHSGWLYLRVMMQIFAGLFTYALLTRLEFSRFTALLAGLMYGCSSSFIILAHAPSATLPFTPLLLVGIERMRAAAILAVPMGWSLVTVAVAYSFYAGFPETALFGDLLGGAWIAARLIGQPPDIVWRCLLKFCLATGFGFILMLPALLPFVQYVKLGSLGGHTADFATGRLNRLCISEQILPMIFGPLGMLPAGFPPLRQILLMRHLDVSQMDIGGWFGALPILLAIAGALSPTKNWRAVKWTMILWIVIFQARSFGLPGVTYLMSLIHPLSLIAVFRYAQPSCDFCLIMLAAMAIETWRRGHLSARAIGITTVLVTIYFVIAVWLAWPVLSFLHTNYAGWDSIPAIYTGGAAIAVFVLINMLRASPRRRNSIQLAMLLVLNCVVCFAFSQATGAVTSKTDFTAIDFLRGNAGLSRVYTLGPLAPNYNVDFGIAEINHNALPVPKSWTDYVSSQLDSGADPIIFDGAAGARATFLPTPATALLADLAAYQAIGVKYILAKPADDSLAKLPKIAGPTLVLQTATANIYQLPDPAAYFTTAGSSCVLTPEDRQSLQASCPASALLIRHELLYPGWRATTDGTPAPISSAGTIFQAIQLPAGKTTIRFFYRPTNERLACALAMLAGFFWLLAGVHARFWPPRRNRSFTFSS